jgi:cysteine synthase
MGQEVRDGFSATIGNTPLIRLRRASAATGCEILGKAEFLNPGGSVKDRAARGILDDAERRGLIAPGGTFVEGTAGNTGIGFAHLCNARGYKCVIVMPDNQSPEKAALLRTLGAEVRVVKTVPYSDPNHYQKLAPKVAEELGAAATRTMPPRVPRSGVTPRDASTRLLARREPAAPSVASRATSRSRSLPCASCWPIRWAAPCTIGSRMAS